MPKRTSNQIKKEILKALKEGKSFTFAQLERKVNTDYRSIVLNCNDLETFGAVKIEKKEKNESNGRPYFSVTITNDGKNLLKRI